MKTLPIELDFFKYAKGKKDSEDQEGKGKGKDIAEVVDVEASIPSAEEGSQKRKSEKALGQYRCLCYFRKSLTPQSS